MKIRALAATEANWNGHCFTREALEHMAMTTSPSPVTLNFDWKRPIGKTTGMRVTAEGLEVDAVLTSPPEDLPLYLVPAGTVVVSHSEPDGTVIIDEMELEGFAFTKEAADSTLRPFRRRIAPLFWLKAAMVRFFDELATVENPLTLMALLIFTPVLIPLWLIGELVRGR